MESIKDVFTLVLCASSAVSCAFWVRSATVKAPYKAKQDASGMLEASISVKTERGHFDVLETADRDFAGIDLAEFEHFDFRRAVGDHPAGQRKFSKGAVVVPVCAERGLAEVLGHDLADRHRAVPPSRLSSNTDVLEMRFSAARMVPGESLNSRATSITRL